MASTRLDKGTADDIAWIPLSEQLQKRSQSALE